MIMEKSGATLLNKVRRFHVILLRDLVGENIDFTIFLKSISQHILPVLFAGTYQPVEYILRCKPLIILLNHALVLMGYKMCRQSALV